MGRCGVLAGLVLALAVWASPAPAAVYVGSEQCFTCHADIYNSWQSTGHPWKLRKAEKARYAKLPLPPGYSWDDISYVIGGAVKKARYIDRQGFIITAAKDGSEAKTQYNLEDGSWSFYNKGQKTPYKCGPCHMTGYQAEGNQDGLPGMIGTWVEDGIGCEECHGPASDHIARPQKANIRIDTSADACGKCHQRGGLGPEPPAKGGFIEHHEQINELKAGPHGKMSCTSCHNPHQRAVQTELTCGKCHAKIVKSFEKNVHNSGAEACITCHMPKVTKSAISVATYIGDVKTHIFRINPDPKAGMFREVTGADGKTATFAQPYVTVEYACLSCHAQRDKAWAAAKAKDYHGRK